MKLTSSQRSYLTKHSHNIKPVVYVGQNGLTEGVGDAVIEALKHNEIVKVKFISNKELKKEISGELEKYTEATLVRVIGNIAIYYKAFDKKADRVLRLPK